MRTARVIVLAVAGAAWLGAQTPILNEAPRLPASVKAASTGAVASASGVQSRALTSTWIDTSSRSAVQAAYLNTFVPTRAVAMGWVGDLSTGNAGTTAQSYRDAVALRINWLRSLAGISSNVVLSDTLNQKDQQAAMMMSVNAQLSHNPPSTWTFYTAAGAEAAQNSNLCLGFFATDPGCLELYYQDFGASNSFAGHRRWLLYPQTATMGTGDVPGSSIPPRYSANAIWVIDQATYGGPRPATRDSFIAWPPKGYVPYQLVYPRWSFSYPGANFTNAAVSMVRNGVTVPVRLETVANGYGDNTLVWVPDNQDANTYMTPVSPGDDVTSTVTITGVSGTNVPSSFTYNVTVFDPTAVVAASYTISPTSADFPSAGGVGSINLTEDPAGSTWQAVSNSSWLTVTSGATGTVSATISYSVAANPATTSRTGLLSIAGQTFVVTQAGAAPPALSLSLTAASALYNNYSAYSLSSRNLTAQTRAVTLSANTGAVAYSSTVTGTPRFLTVSSSSGTTPASLTLTANPAGLVSGTYTNTATFTSGSATVSYTMVLVVEPAATTAAKVGVFRASSGLFLLDRNGDSSCCDGDLIGFLGQTGDVPLMGDWTGDGIKKSGIYRPSSGLILLDVNNNGTYDGTGAGKDKSLFFAAQAGDVPVVGDWAGTGVDRIGVFRGSAGTWYLDVNGDGSFPGRAFLGQTGDIPLVGNWNGVGLATKVGIYRPLSVNGQPGNFFLVDTNGDGVYNSSDQGLFFLGQTGDVPMVGDWSGNGKTKVGVFRPAGSANGPGLMILDQNGSFSWDGPGVDKVLYFAPYLNGTSVSTTIQAGDIPVTGNWARSYAPGASSPNDRTRVGIYRANTGTFFLDVTADGTFQGRAFLGQSGDVPLGVPAVSGGTVIGVNGLGMY